MAKCEWDPNKHDGKPCPFHEAEERLEASKLLGVGPEFIPVELKILDRGKNGFNLGKTDGGIYHGTSSKNAKSIDRIGFNRPVFASDSGYDAEGYGEKIIELDSDILNHLHLKNIDADEYSKINPSKIEGYDGAIYTRNGIRTIIISNLDKLNYLLGRKK